MGAAHLLWKRQSSSDLRHDDDDDDNDAWGNESWWWSDTGYAVRYAFVCVIFAAIMIYFVGGYLHALQRVKKGQPPLAYHRWMVRSRVRYQQPHYQPHYQYGLDPYQEGYVMHGYAPPPNPPPAYHGDAPPAYVPPEGASKALADQNYHHHHPAPRPGTEGESSSAAAMAPLPLRQ